MLRKMADRYFFDKRDWKRRLIKYGIIFGISFLPIVIFNLYCSKYFEKRWLLTFVDCVMLLVFVVIGNAIATKIFEKKDIELEKRQKERRELQAKKHKIMEDSYKKIREEKAQKKKAQTDVVIEVPETPVEEKKEVPEKNTTSSKKKTNNNKGRK